ncbi:host cell factor C1 regulator 1 isoform X1 [Cavia porcellus]|uniref:host cell factor C1 regulator 1 isoform X1 n=1 Tax=Cavia porcellus TaxID=10141 RepID=UPI002FE049F3
MIQQHPLERAYPALALRATSGVTRDLDTRSPYSELLLWRYPGSLIPETLWLLRIGDTSSPHFAAIPAGDTIKL